MNANAHLLSSPAGRKGRKPSRGRVLRLEWQEAAAAATLVEMRFLAAVATAQVFAEKGRTDAQANADLRVADLARQRLEADARTQAARTAYAEHITELLRHSTKLPKELA